MNHSMLPATPALQSIGRWRVGRRRVGQKGSEYEGGPETVAAAAAGEPIMVEGRAVLAEGQALAKEEEKGERWCWQRSGGDDDDGGDGDDDVGQALVWAEHDPIDTDPHGAGVDRRPIALHCPASR